MDYFIEITHIPSYADMRSDLWVICQMCLGYKVSSANKAHIQSAVRAEVNIRSEETATNDT